MVVDLFGEGLSMTTVGKVVAGLSVNFSGERNESGKMVSNGRR